jgi:predicted DNA-binding protein (MmcQ/YjbR family)
MDAPTLRALCLGFPGAGEERPFGPITTAFKVAGRIFALSALEEELVRVSLKCEPELAEQLRISYPTIVPGYHLNKRHWNTITLDGSLSDQLVHDLVEDSYDLVVAGLPKRVRDELGWGVSP